MPLTLRGGKGLCYFVELEAAVRRFKGYQLLYLKVRTKFNI